MNRLERRNYGNGHGYKLDGRKVPGVTSVCGVLDKPALVDWAARESANYAVENWDELAEQPLMTRAKKIQEARFAKNKAAVTRGHRIHWFGEQLAHGVSVIVPDELRGPVDAYARFLDRWEVETFALESPCAHTAYQYAGTLDGIVHIPRLGRVLLDIKSGSGVWPEVSLQLAGYRYCDLVQVAAPADPGKKPIYVEQPMPEVDGCYVAHVLADDVELLPVEAGPEEWSSFLYARELYEWRERRSNRKSDDYVSPIGDAIYPEQVTA